ncbi:peptidoglycan-binding protein [Agrobacterium sp.]|uniref:peptidoglycan-binding protein n=1 Tax=Agrobacterium sp. TaxID=361 RepID=UPI0028AE3BBD|nr:peptidoglycan-binding protein [Agrobacterium sp.]
MNGSRPSRYSDNGRSSLDALSRTIEGLEARIEGLMGQPSQEPQPQRRQDPAERPERVERHVQPPLAARPERFDPINEIRQRQRALNAASRLQPPEEPTEARQPERAPFVPAQRPPLTRTAAPSAEASRRAYQPYEPRQSQPQAASYAPAVQAPAQQAASMQAPAPQSNDTAMRDIAQALVSLRQELKQDLSEGIAREVQGLRSEIRNIKSIAEDNQFVGDIRSDIERLAASIDQLGSSASPHAYDLREEFDDLRGLMDQLARQDSVNRMEDHWQGVEENLSKFDTSALQEEIVSLAYRLDDIKGHLGAMSDSPAVRILEEKLITIAEAVEQLGMHMQPAGGAITEQFSNLDQRLDEISRAIAATSSRTAQPAVDPALFQRLEGRLNGLAAQIDELSSVSARSNPADELAGRMEALTRRIEELANERDAVHLDERLDQLSLMMERAQKPVAQPELTGFLTDISRKIEALDHGTFNDALASRLDDLARRIEDLDYRQAQQQPVAAYDDGAFLRLEERLVDIAARLDETSSSSPADYNVLQNLEDQIANLSSLISQPAPQPEPFVMPAELDARMAAIEDYMASNDEYIIEAARQAAEAVVDAYARKGLSGNVQQTDMTMLNDLASDLRNLENLSRSSEERTHRTFEALHETLVQIAGRLDNFDNRSFSEANFAAVQQSWQDAPVESRPAREQVKEPASGSLFAYAGDEEAAPAKPMFNTAALDRQLSEEAAQQLETAAEALIIPEARPAAEVAVAEMPAAPVKEKRSLLASLTSRFKSEASRTVAAEPQPRTQINPAPSLDPIDVLPAGQENELLEPGSGVPDVKKILERVRASQNAQRDTGKGMGPEVSKADFIAAARRAAQAAAQETMPEKASAAAKKDVIGQEGKTSAFARYRRPILMGIGAILLVMMALPLVKSAIEGDPAPQVIEQAPVQTPGENSAITPSATPDVAQDQVTIPSDLLLENDKAVEQDAAMTANQQPNAIDERVIGGAPLPEAENTQAPAQTQGAPADAVVADQIAIPSEIQPASLVEAAASGNAAALFEVGARYTEGRGVAENAGEAAKWYRLAADRGFAPAQYRLANMLEKGTGVSRDLTEATDYYAKAADQGNAGAMHNLAVLLASDAVGQPDYVKAASWFQKASELGVHDSQFNLAILYARGSGVSQNIEESYKWFAIAANGGDADAAQKRDEVAKAMQPAQLESARAKVAAWKPTPLNEDTNSVNLPDEWAGKEGVTTATVDMTKAIRNIQAILNKNGFDAGTADGQMGKKTVAAIKAFQQSVGQQPDGVISDTLVKALLERNT